ncbi:MAG: clan AA aspartic protease [Nitrospirae bacterium]|nr:clan AA aspartic protease [Nitrospirota bacterium]
MNIYKLERHGHLLMLKSFIEGGEGKAYPRLLLDTGSSYTIISQEILENIGCSPAIAQRRQRIITGSGYEIVPVVRLNKFHCLGKVIEGVEVLAHTLPYGTYVDGLLGMDFLNKFELEIRIHTGEIVIR